MCGIAGIVALGGNPPPSEQQVRAMVQTLAHRGPDDEQVDIRGAVGLGMRRLAVIDVAGGAQPLYNEDRQVRMVFNGEIYNYRELGRQLTGRGHRLTTDSDGEVVPHLWEEQRHRLGLPLNGMFAIALHDQRSDDFCLFRDHLGIKPLYWTKTATHFLFASEIKAILAARLFSPALDCDALAEFLTWEYIPAPRTLLRGVHKLPPGFTLMLQPQSGRIEIERFWDVPMPAGEFRSADEWRHEVGEQIGRSVTAQLVSDVPLGAFLSGGVDSSLVVANMGAAARTFNIGFDDPTYDESRWAHRVAEHLGVDHRSEIIRPQIVELFPRLMHAMDDPIADFSILPTFLVSQVAREEVTVALSGDGGDELFGGYDTYVAQRADRLWRLVPSWLRTEIFAPVFERLRPAPAKKGALNKLKRFVEGASYDCGLRHARWRLFLDGALRRGLFTEELDRQVQLAPEQHILDLFSAAGCRPAIDRELYVDVHSYLVDNCLVKVDRMSMACSLEVRVPLLDHELVSLAFQVPPELKIRGGNTKRLLKEIAASMVPRECVYRQKQGFTVPVKHWLRAELRPLMEELLSQERIADEGLFQPATIARLKTEHLDGTANHSHLLWALMVFQDWRTRWGVG